MRSTATLSTGRGLSGWSEARPWPRDREHEPRRPPATRPAASGARAGARRKEQEDQRVRRDRSRTELQPMIHSPTTERGDAVVGHALPPHLEHPADGPLQRGRSSRSGWTAGVMRRTPRSSPSARARTAVEDSSRRAPRCRATSGTIGTRTRRRRPAAPTEARAVIGVPWDRAATATRARAASSPHRRAQLVAERVEVDLVAQARAEALERPCGVVLAAVEAPVDAGLDAAAGRLEERRDGERRDGDGQAAALRQRAEHELQQQDRDEVGAGEQAVSAP